MPRLACLLLCAFAVAAPPARALVKIGDFPGGPPFERSGTLAFRGQYTGIALPQLEIFDITDLANPVLLSSTPIGDRNDAGIAGIVVLGSYAYLLTRSTSLGVAGRLHIVDLSNPLSPVEEMDVVVAAKGRDIAGAGSLLFVTDYPPGPALHVIDVSSPLQPIEVETLTPPGVSSFEAVDVLGTIVYLGHPQGLLALDFANSSAPAFQSFAPFSYLGLLSHDEPSDLLFASTAAVVPGELRLYDIGDPAHPALLSTWPGGNVVATVAGDRAYLSDCEILDISDPHSPVTINRCSFATGRVFVDGDVAFFADGSIVDLSLPQYPTTLATLATTGPGLGLDLDGTRAYVAEGAVGMRIVDVANPATPHPITLVDTPGGARDVDVRNGFAYVADGPAGLRVVDLHVFPPALRGGFATPQQATAVTAGGTHAYVSVGTTGVAVVDVANPDAPVPVALIPATDAHHVDVQGSRLLLAGGTGGLLRIYDVANPAAPVLLGSVALGDPLDVVRSGSLAYVADYYQGLVILDVSIPTAPVILGRYAFPFATSVAVAGDVVQLGAEGYGQATYLVTLDVSDPAHPVELGGTTGGGRAVAVRGTVVTSLSIAGLRIDDLGPEYDPGPVRCDVAASAASYATGDLLDLATLQFTNPRTAVQPTRLRLQLMLPTGSTVDLLDVGAGGGLALPGSFDVDLGPMPLFAVPASLPRGTYRWRCALEDAVTGALQAEDLASFDLI